MMKVLTWILIYFVFILNACNPLGKESSTNSDYTPGLVPSTPVTNPDTATYIVTVSGDAQITVSPSSIQTVTSGSSAVYTVTSISGYAVSNAVGGTCALGSWSGSAYTTGTINANCTLSFTSVSVGPAGGMGSSWTPSWASLFAYWGFEETSAGTVNGGSADFADQGPVGTHYGTHSGAITYGATGKTGKAIGYTNAGCIQIPAASGFNVTTLTAMAWFKTTGSSIGNILSFYNAAASFQGWALLFNNVAGKATFWGGTGNGFKNSSTAGLNDGNWHHFAVSVNNTSLKMYIDGTLDSTFVISAIPSYTGPGAIGADGDCLQKFTGTIDEMAVWSSTALTDSDINTIYNYQNTH